LLLQVLTLWIRKSLVELPLLYSLYHKSQAGSSFFIKYQASLAEYS
jgi:hypothetical protein